MRLGFTLRSGPWLLLLLLVALLAAACTAPPPPAPVATAGTAAPPPAAAPAEAARPAAQIPLVTQAPGAGLKIKLGDVSIGADRKVVITFKITDQKDVPLRVEDLDGNPSFTVAKLVEADGLTSYENYFTRTVTGTAYLLDGKQQAPVQGVIQQPSVDSGGKVALKAPGEYTYTSGGTIAQDAYAPNATHVVGAYATRNTRAYVSNDVFTFVPSGGTPKTTQLVSNTEACNQCHDPLALHGGTRRELGLCLTCHTPKNVDPETGQSLDMKILAHKAHNGRNLPSVKAGKPYYIVGYGQSVANLGEIGWPQDIRNCTTCHQKAPQADNWKTKPSATACGSCHDDVDFRQGTNHAGGPQADNSRCVLCHQADGPEFGPSVAGAHTIPAASTQMPGLKAEIVKVANTAPGQKPVVTFTLKDGKGNAVDPAKLDSLAVTVAHPTTDYAHRITEYVRRAGAAATATAAERPDEPSKAVAGADGNLTYTMDLTIDPSWTGSLALGMEGYRSVTIKGPQGKDTAVREAFLNPVAYAAVTDAKPVARRGVVARDNCNQCHKDIGNPAGLSIHGGIRRNTEYCILCHNPSFTDQPAAPNQKETAVESLQFKYMLHSVHKGEERAVATSFGSRAQVKTDEILYPGDLRNCSKCHVKTTYALPLPAGVAATALTGLPGAPKPMQPIQATCVACHADPATVGHANLQTAPGNVETCTTCHGAGKEFAVDKVHARP